MALTLKINIVKNSSVKTLQFNPEATIAEALRIIRERVPDSSPGKISDYGLFCQDDDPSKGKWLEPARTLDFYPLKSGDMLEYKSKVRHLKIKFMDGSVKTLQIDDSHSVGQILDSVCMKMGIGNVEEFSLLVEGQKEDREDIEKTGTIKRDKSVKDVSLKKMEERDKKKMDQLKKKLHTDDEVHWLDHDKTLREQGVDDTHTVLLRRKYFYSDQNVDIKDPVQLGLLYVQCRDGILDGTHPCTQEEASQLGAIQIQVQFGDFEEGKYKFIDLKEFLPKEYVKSKNIEKKIKEEHKKVSGHDELQAKYKYVQLCRGLKTYGVTFFLVKEKMKGKNKLVPRLLGVTKESILRVDEKTKEVMKTWPLTTVRRWAASPNSFTLDFGDYLESYYSVQTNEGKKISQLIAGYIDIILKKRKGQEGYDPDFDEESTMVEDSVTPSKGTYLERQTNKVGHAATGSVALPAVMRAGGPVVPPEIRARGRLALEAYNKALTEGMTCVKRVPIMLIGQDRSGKTSLKNSLRGKRFNRDEDSTVGIDVDPSHFKVSTELWKAGEKNEATDSDTALSCEHHAGRLAAEMLRQEKSVPEEKVRESARSGNVPLVDTAASNVNSDSILVPSHVSSTSNHSPVEVSGVLTNPECNEMPQDTEPAQTSSIQERSGKYGPNASARDKSNLAQWQKEDSPFLAPTVPEEIVMLIERLLTEVNHVEGDGEIYSVLWDFGGQSVYYATHPIFLTARAMYLLVYDLSRNPSEEAKPVVKQGMFRKYEDSFGTKTNLDYLDFWMTSVASLGNQTGNYEMSSHSEVLPEKLPPVFLVCTHADEPHGGGSSSRLAQEIFCSLQTKPYKTHLYDGVFAVDNTKSGLETECPEVARLRKEVLSVAKELPQMKETIPIKWLNYEQALQVTRKQGHKWITLESAKQIASEVCSVVDDQQFQTLLNFFHDQRILIHFDDTPELNKLVILDPQWLVDVFKRVITITPYCNQEKEFRELWFNLERTGILEEKLLKHLWGPLFDNKDTSENLIAIMEKFSLLCPWPSSETSCGKQYLVPSMLMSLPPEDIIKLVASAQLPSLFIKFESGQVPPGFFPRLVLQFFQWGREEFLSPVTPQLYHNFARFYRSGDEDCSVILLCNSSSIEIVHHRANANLELADSLQSRMNLSATLRHDTFDVTCVRDVCRQVGLILESMRMEFCWLKNMKYDLCVMCPVCCQGGAVSFCRIHHAQGCKQEECLHFWSESKLRSAKHIVVCTKSAAAMSNKVEVKQLAPWFAHLGEQPAIDEHDGGQLEGSGEKSLDLPIKVVESLMSQWCDPKEIVSQLKEVLQLDQASLEHPESGTKRLIRCLARKAKCSDRFDVVEHLREITPSGTTGPLLHEQLDVRNIPVSQRRELTIDLSSGNEWKVVAERLGLTLREIRFLDNRTLNPCDAALAFIANQRYTSVGSLYDVLNECGFPVIADIL